MTMAQIFLLLVGAVIGAVIAWLAMRSRTMSLNSQVSLLSNDLNGARLQLNALQETNAQLREKAAGLTKALELSSKANQESLDRLREMFSSLAADALRNNNQSFLDLAKSNLETFQSVAER